MRAIDIGEPVEAASLTPTSIGWRQVGDRLIDVGLESTMARMAPGRLAHRWRKISV